MFLKNCEILQKNAKIISFLFSKKSKLLFLFASIESSKWLNLRDLGKGFRSGERKFQETKVPGSESTRERKFLKTSFTYGNFVPGSESTWERKFRNSVKLTGLRSLMEWKPSYIFNAYFGLVNILCAFVLVIFGC